jgi:pyruvate/2-oxoglutarate dehydrogenase complex dihydrolipoamide dehydrogenase (E3) component
MAERQYDVVVIGAGSTGENVADRAVKGGLSAVVVEAELVGGDCSYWACMPSKALLRPLQALAAAQGVAGAREAVTGTLDVAAVLARRDSFAAHWDDASQVKWLGDRRIDLVRGHGRLAGERRVTVTGGVDLTARHAVAVCTGSRAAIPAIPGLAEVRPWTSHEATSAHQAPRRLAILGGGVVACEMATAWGRLGAEELTVIQRGPRLLSGYEPFASEALREALERRGVRVLTGTTARRVKRGADGSVSLSLESGETVVADQVLVAVGRAPRTDDPGSRRSGSSPAPGWRWTTACVSARWPEDGCTPRAT